MGEITKALGENVNRHAASPDETIRARFLSELERAKDLLLQLERPEWRPLIRFAAAWCELDRVLRDLEHKIPARSAEKPIGTVAELYEALIKEN